MSNKIFKECLIIFLLILVIVFAMRILFYDLITEDVDDIMAGAEKKIFDIIQKKSQKSFPIYKSSY